jgi:hypothetical protein
MLPSRAARSVLAPHPRRVYSRSGRSRERCDSRVLRPRSSRSLRIQRIAIGNLRPAHFAELVIRPWTSHLRDHLFRARDRCLRRRGPVTLSSTDQLARTSPARAKARPANQGAFWASLAARMPFFILAVVGGFHHRYRHGHVHRNCSGIRGVPRLGATRRSCPRVGDRADNDRPLRLVVGAILVATASLAAPLLAILAIFATAGAGN